MRGCFRCIAKYPPWKEDLYAFYPHFFVPVSKSYLPGWGHRYVEDTPSKDAYIVIRDNGSERLFSPLCSVDCVMVCDDVCLVVCMLVCDGLCV